MNKKINALIIDICDQVEEVPLSLILEKIEEIRPYAELGQLTVERDRMFDIGRTADHWYDHLQLLNKKIRHLTEKLK